ncbi:MAG: PAC2 family protein [Acidimicrobiales bacterium]
MDDIRWRDKPLHPRPTVMVLAFEGWNDAGGAASTAARHIADRFNSTVVGCIDAERFYDFSSTRPFVRLGDDGRELEWPDTKIHFAQLPGHDHDLVILLGHEPQLMWRTFSENVVAIAKAYNATMAVSLGALIAEVAHTRPITVFGTSQHTAVRERLDLEPSTYEGPTGIVGVLSQALDQAGLETVSLWGSVPNYAPHAPSPKAALALVERVAHLLELKIPAAALEVGAQAYETQITRLVANDDDMVSYVTQLEHEYDAAMKPESADELIQDLEEFLRGQD